VANEKEKSGQRLLPLPLPLLIATLLLLHPFLHGCSQGVSSPIQVGEHIRKVIESLPPDSRLRLDLEEGARGNGVHYPWMNLMQKEGVRRVLVVVSFDWDGHAQNMKVNRLVFYNKYDTDCAQITDERVLDRIRTSGLEQQLEQFAISRTSSSKWYSVDDKRKHARGMNRVYAFDDEWLPHPGNFFFDPSSSPGYHFPIGFLEDEVAVAQFANSAQVTRKNLDDALMEASGDIDDSCVIKPLVAAGANMNPHNEFGTTPLLFAVQSGVANDVRALLEAGADPNPRDSDGKTPLWNAEQGHGRYYPEVIKLLKNHGAKY
jgi:hypothetical protein